MGRPKNKQELLDLGQSNFQKLNEMIDSMKMAEQQKDFPVGTMNRNIGDVLMHLHHWHLMMMDWYRIGMTGKKPDMPAKGYTWKTTPALNKSIWEMYKNIPLAKAKQKFSESFNQLRKIIESHTNEELFEKKRYKWTGSTSMGSYLVSATSSHYDWAYKLIKKAKK